MTEKIKKITSVLILLSLLSFYFAAPFTIKKADAFLGIPGTEWTITMGDIPRYIGELAMTIAKYGLGKLKKRMLTQIQNDLVNWVQNGGEPRFIKDPVKFLKDSVDTTAAKEIDKLFLSKSINICSPFKANVRFLVSKPLLLKEESVRCSLGDMVDNLENFAQNFENGGWTAWLKLHETQNTLPGSYLAATELIGADIERSGNTAQATLSAGKGFLDQKLCSKAKIPIYNLEFVIDSGPDAGDLREVVLDPSLAKELLDTEVLSWQEVWPTLNAGVEINLVNPFSIEIVHTGEFKTEDYLPPIKKLPPGASCIKEETITPGSIIGDQISGVLEKTGIDNIINADEIAQILDAVLDAAVNRVAREGLSYMKSGRGSYTVPAPLSDRAIKQKNQDLFGLESAETISFQNQLIDLRNSSSKLKLDTKKLSGKADKLAAFNERLDFIAGRYPVDGGGYTESGLLKNTLLTKESDKKFSDVADRFFSKYNTGLFLEDTIPVDTDGDGTYDNADYDDDGDGINDIDDYDTDGDGIDNTEEITGIALPPSGSNFNKEENMPGLYLANQTINTKLADIWRAISSVFGVLSQPAAYGLKTRCKDIQYVLEPEVRGGIDALPFTNPDGIAIDWSSNNKSYVTRIKDAVTEYITLDYTIFYMIAEANTADLKSQEYRQIADFYESSAASVESIISELESDGEFVRSQMPNVILYASILMDYDRIGRNHNLIKKIKTHSEILGSKNKVLKIPQADGTVLVLTNKEAEERAYSDLISARIATMNEWLVQAQSAAVADSGNANLQTKANIIGTAKSLIESSWLPDADEPVPTDAAGIPIINTSNLGIKTSDAVAEAMNLNIGALRSEMEERQQRLGKQQTDVSNRLGKFIEDSQLRKQASIEGGDSEWEKHFKNRMQLVYAAHIYDFYKNRFVDKMCRS